ncbi:fibroblast growth factor receptor 2-like [Branchiostoma lanceolatum]|uniref:fibroblast growth factor receptor 2-like n=1 Tax=Branchiostoma lanceolatum TaxID=7740 RepID=UPI00345725C2
MSRPWCESGEFGPGCTGTCHCASGGSVCDVMTGICSSGGCEDGWKGNNCQTVCTPGEFGPDCTGTCHCASGGSVCNIQTGVCSSGGCAAGWKGSNCQTVCFPDEFGPGCTGTCHCADGGSVCDVTDGVCSSGGCEAGWKGSNCQTVCTPGEFGPGCTGTCHCASGGSVCDVMTGVCSSGGCAAGWKGSNCQTVCSPGEFGPGCTGICHCESGVSVCDVMTGVCSSGGCEDGWEGNNCQIGCDAGSYGEGCTETCGHCVAETTCDVTTGICNRCEPPWVGGFCVEILAEVIEHPHDLNVPLNQPATFTCTSRGEPLPTVMWHHGDDQLSANGDMLINATTDSSSHTVTSTLTISSVKRGNNGQYTCRSINGTISDTSRAAELKVLERPEDVTVTLTSPSSTTMQVTWTVGFTGNIDINASEVTHKRSDEASWGPWVTTESTGTEGTHELIGLSSAKNYSVKLRVRNSQGWSDPVEAEGRTRNAPSTSSLGAVIGGTAGGVVVLIGVVAISLFFYRRKKSPKQTDNRELSLTNIGDSMEPHDSSGTLNEAFASEDDIQKDCRRLSQVKTVQDVKNFLQAHDLKELTTSFEENDVDGRALRGMNDAILKDLIPKAGPRARLAALLVELKTPDKPVHPDVPTSNLNYWEIPRANLKLGKRLGRGQFGEVRLGEVRNRGVTKTVAVKTLKDSASDSDKKDLLGELDILVTVGQHENIISLVGACTKDGPLSIVVEYARNGCLKDWLVTNSAALNTDSEYQNQPVSLSLLPMEQLIKFGIDVASGMSHLAAMQCLHRDLAARNVLLGKNLEAKVSDFGLSRDVYESSEYVKSTKSKLPLRWMAYESLFYNVYTSQSDVWSFGVLLWEIITLGKQPYEGMNGKRMMDLIKDGGRLEKPTPCPDEMYTIMTTCWKTLPEDRPSFPQLKSSLNRIMQDSQHYTSLLK